jgi:hypothetical protein
MLESPHMKTKKSNSSDLKIKFGSVFPALLLAGAILCGPGWGVQRCAAQLFPSSAGDEQSYSIGVFQLTVNPAFNFLFAPYPNTPGNYYYPGFSPVGGVLTSPTMYDFVDTYIAVSASHNRAANPTYFTSPDPGGVRVGTVAHPGFPNFIPNYSPRYAFLPPVFATAPNNVDEIMTEIEGFNLATTTGSAGQLNCPTHDPRVPDLGPSININMVVAGPAFIPGLPQNRRSIGMVQQLPPIVAGTDFPAQSFFDIFVEVTLPQTSGNNSAIDFPGLLSGIPRPPGQTQDGAVLYNDANNPLVIVNPNVMSLPPTAVYIHGQTLAVPMKFKYANPPYWAADDVIGYLVLAGHGVFPNPSNDCAKVAGGVTTLLDQTLGPVGAPMPGMAIPWVQPTNTFPTPNSGYDSLVDTIVDPTSGVTNVNDDTVSFPNGTGFVYIRDISLGNFNNSIQPPPPSSSATYSEANTEMLFELSQDGVNWSTESATGPMMASISNTTVAGSTSTFDTEMLQLDISGGSLPPAMMIRESPTKQSLGKHTIAPDPHGYRVSSFFDVFLELSVNDGLDWIPAERSIRVQASVPPAAPGSIFGSKAGPNILLQWQNNFTLQSTPDLNVPFTDVGGPVPVTSGIYSNLMSGHAMFYRLRK